MTHQRVVDDACYALVFERATIHAVHIVVEVSCAGSLRPPAGSSVIVRIQDTSLADAPARIIAEATGSVASAQTGPIATLTLSVAGAVPPQSTVRVHIDVDGDGRVSRGDFVSTASHPLPQGESVTLGVPVRPV